MAKEVTISTWCDLCMATGTRVVASHSPIIAMSVWPKPQEIDLCDDHYAIIEQVDAMITKHGRASDDEPVAAPVRRTRVGRKPDHDLVSDPDSLGCPVCLKLYSGKGTTKTKYLAQHMRVQHAPKSIKDFTEDELLTATAEARAKIVDHG